MPSDRRKKIGNVVSIAVTVADATCQGVTTRFVDIACELLT